MTLPAGVTSGYPFSLYSSQTSQLYLGTDAQIKGLFYAPDAEVHVYSRTQITGSLFGRRVVLEPQVTVCKPPTLLGLSHSEGAMAPPFDPIRFSYVAVVPDATATITVLPVAAAGQTVKVNGNDPSYPVNLTGEETDINILLSHPEACGSTEYKLKVKRSADAALYVNPKSTCPPAQQDGTTWQTAFSSLTTALSRAAIEGKELRLAEGVYTPTDRLNPPDPRSATFLVQSGMEIIGGFTGEETDGEPAGDPKETVFTGDINGDDSSITAWPPVASQVQFADDNAYHVITIVGNPKSADISLENMVVTHGYANGTGLNAVGGGGIVKSGKPSFDFVGFVDNYAKSGGAGLQVCENGAVDFIHNCLFQNNYTLTGSGGGMSYVSAAPLVIDASVFDNNTTGDTASVQGGSALYVKKATTEFVNCVFAQNKSFSSKGAVVNDAGILSITNCTFAYNTGNGAVSICNVNNGTTNAENSILWNSSLKNEVSGGKMYISHSCITTTVGYTGTSNINVDPAFQLPAKPAGNDGSWGSYDDGLMLKSTSPCLNVSDYYPPNVDILTTQRDYNADIGAYEFTEFVENNQTYFGIKYGAGQFFADNTVHVFKPFVSKWRKQLAINSKNARYIRVLVPKNKYTEDKHTLKLYVHVTKNTAIMTDVDRQNVTMQREEERINGQYVYYSNKPVVFINDKGYVNQFSDNPDDDAYYVYGSNESGFGFRFILPSSQF